MKQLDSLQEIKTGPACDVCEASNDKRLYTPLDAIKDINSGKLVYMGRTLMPGSGENLSCIYKSETAYIIYNNCMGSKKESSATDIEIISFEGGKSHFYIQNKEHLAPVSTLTRSDYNMVWTVEYVESPPPGKLGLPELKKYLEKNEARLKGYCFIGATFKAQDMTQEAHCKGLDPAFMANWKEKTTAFWKEPGEEWYKAKKYLRKTTLETKY